MTAETRVFAEALPPCPRSNDARSPARAAETFLVSIERLRSVATGHRAGRKGGLESSRRRHRLSCALFCASAPPPFVVSLPRTRAASSGRRASWAP